MGEDNTAARLDTGIERLGLQLSGGRRSLLHDYLALLQKWNRTYSLTAVTAPREMVSRHLLDSLSVLPLIRGERVADVGSGPGLPGIPLAIADPGRRYVLLDSNGKKTRFMTHAIGRLGLANVSVVRCRVEDYAAEVAFDTVVSRAFASLSEFIRLSGHLCDPRGRMIAMKGKLDRDELAGVPCGWRIAAKREVSVPGLNATRHLVLLLPETATELNR